MEKSIIEISFSSSRNGDIIGNYDYLNGDVCFVITSIEELITFLSNSKSYINYEEITEDIKKTINIDDSNTYNTENVLKDFDNYYKNIINGNYEFVINICDDFEFEDIKKIISILKKRIEIIYVPYLDINQISLLLKNTDISDETTIITKYNYDDDCTKSELLELIGYLNNIKNLISRYNLSPLEICIFVYDLIRERPYKRSKSELLTSEMTKDKMSYIIQDRSNSRSIMKIFKSDEIVCAGFANLFSAILDLMGIKSSTIIYIPTVEKNGGHMSNMVYINDSKYGVRGLFEIDSTWGRHTKSDGNYDYQKSLYDYKYFAVSLSNAIKSKKRSNLEFYSSDINVIKLLKCMEKTYDTIEYTPINIFILRNLREMIECCRNLNNIIEDNLLTDEIVILKDIFDKCSSRENIDMEEIKKVLSRINKKIFICLLPSFKQALYRVKLVEHSIDKDKYPVTVESVEDAAETRIATFEERLMEQLFFEPEEVNLDQEELNIARMELISVLHKLAKDDIDKNPTNHI